MLQNGLIILTVWSLMRMAHFTHDYDYIDLPIVNFPYLSSNIPESHTNDVFDLQFIYVMLGFVQNLKIFCSDDLFWFQRY